MTSSRLYIFDDIDSFTDKDLRESLALVSARRREKAISYLNVKDRKLSAIAGLILFRATGIRNPEMKSTENGKPVFADPALPHFNLSHCDLAVACAVSAQPVGVDVESYASYREDVAREVFNSDELQRVTGSPAMFAELWTVKESYLKYTGEGLSCDLPTLMETRLPVSFRTWHYSKGYCCTVCSTSPLNLLDPIFIDKRFLLHG